MGYCMQQRSSRFRMVAEKLPAALAAVQALAEQKTSYKWGILILRKHQQ